MSNDGTSGGAENYQHQSNFEGHNLSYLDQEKNMSHAIPATSGTGEIESRSHPIKLSEGSPPPSSATTSGSTSTPTSSGGVSSGGDNKHSEQARGSMSSHYCPPFHQQLSEGWPVSIAEEGISQSYADAHRSAAYHGVAPEVSFAESPPDARYNPASNPSAVKLMVSNNVAGSIIGRAGQTISELQTQSSARIKLSQAGDYYPGTQDRVCLVQGDLENVKVAVGLLLQRLHMLQEQQHTQHSSWQGKPGEAAVPPSRFDFVVRMLVPSTSCGMIIGKAGANIKHMEESSGVSSVRLSPKDIADPHNPTTALVSGTGERVVTLTGPAVKNCLHCLCIVLEAMASNHEICRYTNMTTSYSKLLLPGTYTPVQPGRPMVVVPPPTGEWDAQGHYNQFPDKRSTSQQDLLQGAVDHQRSSMRMAPGSPRLPREATIQQYNQDFSDLAQNHSAEMPSMMPSPARGPPTSTSTSPMYLFPGPSAGSADHLSLSNSSSAPDLLALQFQENMRLGNPPTSAPVDFSQFAPQLPQHTPPGFSAQILVPDSLIGSILGRGGKTLNELQMHSNTRIRISQRGEYMPGTRNRIVTIRGPTAHSVSLAQYLMSQRMVMPPTSTYSAQGALQLLHPSQLQPAHLPLYQNSPPNQHAQQHHLSPLPHAQVQQPPSLHEDSILSNDSASALAISRNLSSKDPPPPSDS